MELLCLYSWSDGGVVVVKGGGVSKVGVVSGENMSDGELVCSCVRYILGGVSIVGVSSMGVSSGCGLWDIFNPSSLYSKVSSSVELLLLSVPLLHLFSPCFGLRLFSC